MADTDDLLRILIQVTGRTAFPEERLREIVGTSPKHLAAYNLCDGTRVQAEVVKAAKIDQGSFSKTASRWVEEGALFRIGTDRDVKLLHVYPLTNKPKTAKKGS
jgi:hypothetical protein